MKKGFRKLIFTLVPTVALTFLFTTLALPEDITMTTFYPAPFGVYREFRAERTAIGATYHDATQHCWPGGPCAAPDIGANADLVVEGNVGIGTVNPTTAANPNGNTTGNLDVNDVWLRDANAGAGRWASETSGGLGAWTARSSGTTYLAATDGFTLATGSVLSAHIAGYTDGGSPPTTRRITTSISPAAGEIHSFMMPVRKGDYWRVTNATAVWWIPLGT